VVLLARACTESRWSRDSSWEHRDEGSVPEDRELDGRWPWQQCLGCLVCVSFVVRLWLELVMAIECADAHSGEASCGLCAAVLHGEQMSFRRVMTLACVRFVAGS